MIYKIFFELYGKKLVTKINAKNEIEAKEKIKDKIIFHKIESPDAEQFERIKEILNIK